MFKLHKEFNVKPTLEKDSTINPASIESTDALLIFISKPISTCSPIIFFKVNVLNIWYLILHRALY